MLIGQVYYGVWPPAMARNAPKRACLGIFPRKNAKKRKARKAIRKSLCEPRVPSRLRESFQDMTQN